jgi:hydrogenase maturation factor
VSRQPDFSSAPRPSLVPRGERLAVAAGVLALALAGVLAWRARDEARVARSFAGVTSMHDVTEGGLATAIRELGAAGGRRLRVHVDRIPVYPQTARVSSVLGIDPLGLIGSGSLLITCSSADAGPLAAAVADVGIEIADIGEVLEPGEGVEALNGGVPVEWPRFVRDEVSRVNR